MARTFIAESFYDKLYGFGRHPQSRHLDCRKEGINAARFAEDADDLRRQK